MQYSILIFGAEGIYDRLPKEEQEALMQGHQDLQEELASRGSYATARLMPSSNAVTLKPPAKMKQKPLVVDGPFIETKERLLGFYVVDGDSLDEAIELAELIASPYVTLEVRPVSWGGGLFNAS